MRGADADNEALFTAVKIEGSVPAKHPLQPIRARVNDALSKMEVKFSAMYGADFKADVKSGRPSIALEKLMRAMLLQVLYSVRSERQLVVQVQYNLLFRWFARLVFENTVVDRSVFRTNSDRLIEHDAVTKPFDTTVEMADKRGLLSGEHFSVDGNLIQAWKSHKSKRRRDESDDGHPPEDWRGEPRSNDTHESTSDPDSRLYRKNNAAPALPGYLGHVFTDNRQGLVVNAQASISNETAKRVVAQMLADVAGAGTRVTVRAGKAYDNTKSFVNACRDISVTPHVEQNITHIGGGAIDGRASRHSGFEASQHKRMRIEQRFGLGKRIGPIGQVMVQGLNSVEALLTLTMGTCNLTRLRPLEQVGPQCAQ